MINTIGLEYKLLFGSFSNFLHMEYINREVWWIFTFVNLILGWRLVIYHCVTFGTRCIELFLIDLPVQSVPS